MTKEEIEKKYGKLGQDETYVMIDLTESRYDAYTIRKLSGISCTSSMFLGSPDNKFYICVIPINNVPKLEIGLGVKCLDRTEFAKRVTALIDAKLSRRPADKSGTQIWEGWYGMLEALKVDMNNLELETQRPALNSDAQLSMQDWAENLENSYIPRSFEEFCSYKSSFLAAYDKDRVSKRRIADITATDVDPDSTAKRAKTPILINSESTNSCEELPSLDKDAKISKRRLSDITPVTNSSEELRSFGKVARIYKRRLSEITLPESKKVGNTLDVEPDSIIDAPKAQGVKRLDTDSQKRLDALYAFDIFVKSKAKLSGLEVGPYVVYNEQGISCKNGM